MRAGWLPDHAHCAAKPNLLRWPGAEPTRRTAAPGLRTRVVSDGFARVPGTLACTGLRSRDPGSASLDVGGCNREAGLAVVVAPVRAGFDARKDSVRRTRAVAVLLRGREVVTAPRRVTPVASTLGFTPGLDGGAWLFTDDLRTVVRLQPVFPAGRLAVCCVLSTLAARIRRRRCWLRAAANFVGACMPERRSCATAGLDVPMSAWAVVGLGGAILVVAGLGVAAFVVAGLVVAGLGKAAFGIVGGTRSDDCLCETACRWFRVGSTSTCPSGVVSLGWQPDGASTAASTGGGSGAGTMPPPHAAGGGTAGTWAAGLCEGAQGGGTGALPAGRAAAGVPSDDFPFSARACKLAERCAGEAMDVPAPVAAPSSPSSSSHSATCASLGGDISGDISGDIPPSALLVPNDLANMTSVMRPVTGFAALLARKSNDDPEAKSSRLVLGAGTCALGWACRSKTRVQY